MSNQIRRKPGVFSRKKKNGQLESEFNLEKGANFALNIDPQKQLFYFSLKTGTRKYHLYNLLSSLGISETKIKNEWGEELFRKNKTRALRTERSELVDLYKKLVDKREVPNKLSEIRKGLRGYFNETAMDGQVNKLTLGSSYDKASPESMLTASTKLLKINKGEEKPDERDSLIYKEIYTPDDLLKEHFKGNRKTIKRKIQNSLANRDQVREVMSANAFTKPIRTFFTTSDISSTPPQTNPVAMATNGRKTTSMGPGGIQSEHAITMETRDVHPSSFGFLDPLSTPEGPKIGVNIGLASEVEKKGKDMTTPVVMPNGDIEYKTPLEIHKATVGFPDQFERKGKGKPRALHNEVKVMKKNKPAKVPKKEVDFWFRSPRSMFDLNTNLIPFLSTTQGNRGSTAARMITQALPLDNPDTPNSVAVKDEKTGETYEDLMGQYLLPSLEQETGKKSSKGEVTKVDDDYIHIKTDKGENVKVGLYNDFSLNQDGHLNTKPLVKKGDKVEGDDILAKSNYTDDKGRLAMGKNLNVAYVSYKGNSFEDGATITESAAEKLTHSTIDRKNISFDPNEAVFSKKKFRSHFPEEVSPANMDKLDSEGLPKVGEEFKSGETLVAFLSEKDENLLDQSIKKLYKSSYRPFRKNIQEWDSDDVGKVVDVRKSGRNLDIYVKSKHKFKEGDKLCIDRETEILTDRGWKTITQLRGSEKFCTLNPNTEEIEYQKASQINIYDHKGEMYHVSNSNLDQMVTKNHRMFVNPRNPVSMDWGLLPASNIFGKRVKYKKSGIWKGSKLNIPDIIDHQITPEQFSTFMGWYLSEGNTCKTTKGYVTVIHQSKKVNPKNYNEIKELIGDMGLTPICQKDRVSFNSKSMYLYLNRFGHSHEKYVPQNIKDSHPQLISLFIESYVKGDGTITDTGQRCIITSSTEMRDDLMELILKTGKAANYRLHTEKGAEGNFGTSNYDIWDIREIRTKLTPSVNHGHVHEQKVQTEEYVEYSGKVGCPTTPNGIIYIRRNGKTSWTGNSSRYGDKHIIGKIIPDDEAPHRPNGEPVDIMVNPQGVQGRMNMGQLLDTAAGKIAKEEGKPYEVLNFDNPDGDDAKEVQNKLKELGIEANETLTDGKNGEPLENPVFVGNRQYLKLRHLVKKKMASNSFGTYDIDEQPAGKGAQKVGVLDTYSQLAHGAKDFLREKTTITGQENEEYFRNLQFGLPPSKPNSPAVFDKMMDYLKISGVDTEKKGNKIQLVPLTDKKVEKLSKGEIPNPGQMLIGKNLTSKKGGLFDEELTGGLKGENYNHINIPKRLPNPMSETAIKSVLELTNKQYEAIMAGNDELNGKTGSEAIIKALEGVNVSKELEDAKKELKSAPKSKVNKLNTKVRILDALDKKGLGAKEAYSMSKVLVVPPKSRPTYPLPSGDLQVSDINKHYRDVGLRSMGLKKALDDENLTKEDEIRFTKNLYESIKSMEGFTDPVTYGKQKYKGGLKDLGDTKKGLIFGKAWAKRQDLSGRSTIVPEPSFGLDEIGVPEKMAEDVFKPFVVRKLTQSGMKAGKALKEVKDNTDLAKNTLQKVMDEKSVVVNRAPALHRHSTQAFKPKLVSGKEIRLNPLVVGGYGADFNGDSVKSLSHIDLQLSPDKYYSGTFGNFVKNILMPGTTNKDLIKLADNGTLILQTKNLKTLGVNMKNELEYVDVSEVTVHTSHGPCYELCIDGELPLGTTEHHNVSFLDLKDLKSKMIKTEDMDSGLIIPIMRKPKISNKKIVESIDLVGDESKVDPRVKINTTDIPLNKEFGYWLGYYVGDGSVIGGNTINMACIRPEGKKVLKNIFTKIFGTDTASEADFTVYEDGARLNFYGAPLYNWLPKNLGKRAKEKKFPDFYLNSPKEFREGLVSGFIDADGSVTTGGGSKNAVIKTQVISRTLISQFKKLLASLDIQSKANIEGRKTDADNTVYNLRVSPADTNKVPFHPNSIKLKRLKEIQKNKKRQVIRGTQDQVPYNNKVHQALVKLGKKNRALTKELRKKKKKYLLSKDDKYTKVVAVKDVKGKELLTRSTAKRLINTRVHVFRNTEYCPPILEKWIKIVENPYVKYARLKDVYEVDR